MNIENYNTFLVLSRLENFSKAAEQLNVVQSTVSSRISELEKYLNVTLFVRNNRKFEITEAGKSLIPYARRLVDLEDESFKTVQSIGAYRESLRVSIPSSIYREILSPIIYDFNETYPYCSLDVRLHKTMTQLEMLIDDDIDIGFISRLPSTRKLHVQPFLEYSWTLVACKTFDIKSTIGRDQLGEINLSYNNLNSQYNEWLGEVLPKGYRPKITINSTLQLIDYVKQGKGCAFIPSYAISNELTSGEFREIKIKGVKANKFKIYLAVNKRRMHADIVKSFLSNWT